MTVITDIYKQIKEKMKADYIAGMTGKEIAFKYGYKNREGMYYYIKGLTPEDMAQHTLNYYKRLERKKTDEEVKEQ